MKVYVLLDEWHHECASLKGVFASLELAQEQAPTTDAWFHNADEAQWEAGHDAYSSGNFYSSWVIYEREVQVKE